MKIAILSMQQVYNYGSVLQAYSLKMLVEEIISEEAKFIDIDQSRTISINMPVQDGMDYAEWDERIKKDLGYYYRKTINYIKKKFFKRNIETFQKQYLHMNREDNDKQYDIVIIGSDEVFKATNSLNLQLYGDVKNAKKIVTYAASCGSAVYEGVPKEAIDSVKNALSNICMMSVRDQHTYDYIYRFYHNDIMFHLDPVLMGNLYRREHRPVSLREYMVVYAYGDRIRKKDEIDAIKNFAKEKKLKIIALGEPQFWCDKYVPATPLRILDYFYYASYVVTDTFHGSIFSIINGCQFATLLRITNKNKLGDLLERLNLQDRIVENVVDLSKIIQKQIDYNVINQLLEDERQRTREYLCAVLNDRG